MKQLHTVLPAEAQIMLIAASDTSGLDETIKRVKVKYPHYFRQEALRELFKDDDFSTGAHPLRVRRKPR